MSRAPVDPSTVRLLLKALDSLESDERTAVLESLLGRVLASTDTAGSGQTVAWDEPSAVQFAFPARLGAPPPAVDQRMFPVRLPERDHTRLKTWCDTHNFPMAVVVRGLIERFLDQQDETPAAGHPAGAR